MDNKVRLQWAKRQAIICLLNYTKACTANIEPYEMRKSNWAKYIKSRLWPLSERQKFRAEVFYNIWSLLEKTRQIIWTRCPNFEKVLFLLTIGNKKRAHPTMIRKSNMLYLL